MQEWKSSPLEFPLNTGFTWFKHDLWHQEIMQRADVVPAWQEHQNCTVLYKEGSMKGEELRTEYALCQRLLDYLL